MFFLKRHLFLLGFFLFAFLTTPVNTVAQNSSNFSITQVFINACLGYIEISVQFDPGDAISYQWYELDSNMNYVLLSGETNRILYVSPGDYKIEVTNSTTGQVLEGIYTLSASFPLVATDLFSGLICNTDLNSGAILVRLDNGSSPYQYTLVDSSGTTVAQGSSPQGQLTILIENLAAGTYTLNWEDRFGCTGTMSIEVDVPVDLNVTSSITEPLCFGGTGGMEFSVNGGWGADYKVQLLNPQGSIVPLSAYSSVTASNGNSPSDGTYYDIGNGQNISLTGLSAGIYTLKYFDEPLKRQFLNFGFDVTNTQTCIREVDIEITEPDELTVQAQDATVTNSSCFNSDNGSILINPTGGTAPYNYAWTTTNGTIQAGQENTNALTNLPPGTYNVTVTDNNTCTFSDSYIITEPNQLTISLDNFANISCNAGTDGEIVVQIDGGTPNYVFTLNGATVTPTSSSGNLYTFSGLGAGNYILTVTDANSCAVTPTEITQVLSEPAALAVSINNFALACFGDSNGVIDGTISGGTAPYAIINDQTNQSASVIINGGSFSFTGLAAGNYTFTITDANSNTGDAGCSTTASASVTEPTELQATAVVTNSTCFGVDNGSIQISPSGGTAPYTFSWTATNGGTIPAGQNTSQNLSGLSAGTYTITVTDNNACTFSDSYTITEPNQLTISLDNFSNISCNGGSDGELVVQFDGGTPNYVFTLNGTTATPTSSSGNLYTFSGLGAGSYILTVTDANSCAVTPTEITQTLSEPAALAVSINNFTLACFGDTNGVIDGIISGGTPPYVIINDQTGTAINIPVANGGAFSFNNLPVGNYTFTINDNKSNTGGTGCSTTVAANVTEPAELTASAVATNISCFGNADGSIQITPSGGTSPYTFSWTATNSGTIPASQNTSQNLSGLSPGTYTVTVTDNNTCTFSDSYTITEPAAINLAATVSTFNSGTGTPINISCNGASDGFINLTPSGGTTPYRFQWTATNGGVIPSGQVNDQNLSGLVKGTYSVVVSDANNCSISSTDYILEEPRLLSGSAAVVQNNQCFSGTLGIIETTIDNTGSVDGVNYTYTISGANLPTGYTTVETTTALTQQFQNLPAGTFTVTVTDANGCAFTTTPQTISQPSTPITISETISDFNGFNISCFGQTDASITLSVTGGTPGSGASSYTYQWTSPSGATVPAGQATTNSLSGIGSGVYEVIITDGTGVCSITQTYTITEPADITLGGTTSDYNSFGVSAAGATDGSIDLNVNGGVSSQAYSFAWSTTNGTIPPGQAILEDPSGLSAGTYDVLVTDANGCTETTSFTLTEPLELLISEVLASHQNVDCFGDSTGIIEISIDQQSVPPYDFVLTQGGTTVQSINTSATNHSFLNLTAGTYDITVTDANGASKTLNGIVITQPASGLTIDSATLSSFNGFEISCFGANDGSINLFISGGYTPYTFSWTASNGTNLSAVNTPNLSALAPGDYTIVITDATGNCSITQTYTITEPTDITLGGTTSDYNSFGVSAAGATDGSIDLNVSGGVSSQAYSFAWSTTNGTIPPGQAILEDPSGLSAGTYDVLVTDANGCTETTSFTLTEPLELLISEVLASHQNVDCFGDSTGIIEISIDQQSVPPYDFVLTQGGTTVQSINTSATNHSFLNLTAGTYDITVTDANGASKTLNGIVITQPANAFTASVNTSSFAGPNGTFEVSCFGNTDGTIDVTLSGGIPFDQGLPTAYYTYTLTNSSGAVVGTGQGTTLNFPNLEADTYTFTATDATGNCSVSETIVMSEPNELVITTDAFQDMQCFGADDGFINVSITGGLGNNTISWTKDGNPFSTQEDIANLEEGIYVLLVVDSVANSCSVSQSYTITEPAPFTVSLDSKTDVLCFGDATGEINITVNGGTPIVGGATPYQFVWTHDSGTTYYTEDLSGVPAGTYDLVATDANGCNATLQVILTQPTQIVFNPTTTDITCYGYNDGSITLNPAGGVPPYSISWSDLGNGTSRTNLSPGIFTATITDAIGCVVSEDIEIIDAPIFSLQGSTSSSISCFGANDGSINLTVTGGVAPLQLTWSDDPTAGIQRNNLAPGIYEVEVIDADSCIQRETFVINEPQELTLSAQINDAIDCTDPNSGAIDLIVNGGTLPYTFAWSNGSLSEDLTAIPANNYSVTVTDANGCTAIGAYTIIRQEPLEATIVSNIQVDCDAKEVIQENELIITGGFPPYSVSWSYGDVDNSNPNIMRTDTNGIAVATITDNNNCVITQNVTVNLLQLGDPDFIMDSAFHTDYNVWAIDDPITFTNTSTGDAQGFSWNFGDGTTSTDENPMHTYVKEGTYQITFTVAYGYGCSYSIQRTIEVVRGYEIEVPDAFSPNKDGVNDVFRPVYLGMQQVKMHIYDTWGGLLYTEESTSNTFTGWDGTLDGKPLENGNYIYQVEALSRNGIEIQKTGPFTLLK